MWNDMVDETLISWSSALIAGLVGIAVSAFLSAYFHYTYQRKLLDRQKKFEIWKLQDPLFRPAYDAYQQVREWGYRLSQKFEKLKGTPFQSLTDEERIDFFIATIKYRRALEKVPLILPGSEDVKPTVKRGYREAEDAAKGLVEKIIKARIYYTSGEAIDYIQDKTGKEIAGSLHRAEISGIWSDFLNAIPNVNPEDAIKTINDHRLAFMQMIEGWYKGPEGA